MHLNRCVEGKATKIRYPWVPEYSDPEYWGHRTPLWLGMPRIVNLYLDLNDNKVRNFLSRQKGIILDAGCGNGRFLSYADVGVDFSKGMLNKARKTGRSLVQASILSLPFRDNAFSVAFSIDVLLHIKPEEQERARMELQRVAQHVYVLLAEHRTVFPIIYHVLHNSPLKPKRLVQYLVFLFVFPVDRLRSIRLQG